jgi:putative oxidoreductase
MIETFSTTLGEHREADERLKYLNKLNLPNSITHESKRETSMKYVALIGRIFYSLIFLMTIMGHFSNQGIGYAQSQGVPLASIAVPLSGIMAMLGGLSVATGFKAKWGALLIILFLVPVTVMMHNFWAVQDPMMAQIQMAMFMKNLSMLGGAILIFHFGSGPMSLDRQAGAPS